MSLPDKNRRGFLKFLGKASVAVATSSVVGKTASAAGLLIKKTTPQSSQTNFTIKQLFLDLAHSQIMQIGTCPPIYNGENYDTIIIVEDIHGNTELLSKEQQSFLQKFFKRAYISRDQKWTKERIQLEYLRQKCGLNFVGVEGWAGKDVDLKRGYSLLNGEMRLVEWIIKNKNYDVVGLEKAEIQFRSLELLVLDHLTSFKTSFVKSVLLLKKILKELDLVRYNSQFDQIFNFADFFNEFRITYYLNEEFQKLIFEERKKTFSKVFTDRTEKLMIVKKELLNLFSLRFKFEKILKEINYLHIVGNYNSAEKTIKKNISKIQDIFLKYFYSDLKFDEKEYDKLVHSAREIFGTFNMLTAMNKYRKNVGIIVFGKAHTKKLMDQIRIQTHNKVNIYVAK